MSVYQEYELTIGIECHVQLATKTKLFSSADNDARNRQPNTCVSGVDYGLPGMLPVLNLEAVNLAVKAGKALNAEIAKVSRFDRKHYFYPDLPKGYQTTQMYQPTILSGHVDVPIEDGTTVKVRIHHAHLEEDAGKLIHYGDYSLVDLNRAGTPLIEIVSEPDIHSPSVARSYATELYRLMTYSGVTLGDLYHGNMRFDVNVSVAKKGTSTLGTRAEVKNLNSFRSVERAAAYEFKRQVDILENDEHVVQETRGWDDDKQVTFSQRSKEDAQDYRYMPDPDIPPIVLSDDEIANIQLSMPKLPAEFRESWRELQLDISVIDSALNSYSLAVLLDSIHVLNERDKNFAMNDLGAIETRYPKLVKKIFNWFASTPSQDIDMEKVEKGQVDPNRLIHLAALAENDEISSNSAKEIFIDLFDGQYDGMTVSEIAEKKNLLQVSDESEIAAVVDKILADPASHKSIEDIRAGKDKAIGYLVGQVMKQSQGKANPALAQKLIRERL